MIMIQIFCLWTECTRYLRTNYKIKKNIFYRKKSIFTQEKYAHVKLRKMTRKVSMRPCKHVLSKSWVMWVTKEGEEILEHVWPSFRHTFELGLDHRVQHHDENWNWVSMTTFISLLTFWCRWKYFSAVKNSRIR